MPFIISLTCFAQNRHVPITMDDLRIDVPQDSSREIAYTNKYAGVLYTETNGVHRSAWQGWRIMSTKMMDDYNIVVDGQSLKKSAAVADVFPHQLVRIYPNGIRESITLIDSVDAIVVQLDHINGKNLSTGILFSNAESSSNLVAAFEDSVLLIARKNHLQRTPKGNYPVWLGMIVPHTYRSSEGKGNHFGGKFSPASINSSIANHRAEVIFVVGNTRSETISLAHRVADQFPALIERRKRRLETLVNRSYIRTDNARFDKALWWAKISMDALIMNQIRKGIFAGLPWFDDYWGRDSFISLAGATLVTGNFREAKEVLYSFARWQDTNSSSTTYGRIPNLVTTSSIAYNTADGTPRFIIALMDYVRYSGDTSVVKEFWPVVKRSIEGTILYHTD
ncbi:MAG TPA: amylo-alpha-1,6-glucosidase, partial [Bacteroidota bacterium]|nr:amylo-alpha-1,6-glucosidase [Bacteroidota bacterium]